MDDGIEPIWLDCYVRNAHQPDYIGDGEYGRELFFQIYHSKFYDQLRHVGYGLGELPVASEYQRDGQQAAEFALQRHDRVDCLHFFGW